MKILILVASVLALGVAAATSSESSSSSESNEIENLETAMAECNETFVIEYSYLDSLNDSGTFPDETDRTPKCFLRCLFEKTGVATEGGDYDAGRAAMLVHSDRKTRTLRDLEESALSCVDRNETCKCERAYSFIKCMYMVDLERHDGNSSKGT